MTKAKKLLIEYQKSKFSSQAIKGDFEGFDERAYPETAKGIYLDFIGKAIRILPRFTEGDRAESCDAYRERILIFLATPDEDHGDKKAA